MSSRERACRLFERRFGKKPSFGAIAPGRVNLIGEHTDYNDGFVMPLALNDMFTSVVGALNTDGIIRIITEASDVGESLVEFPASKDAVLASREPKWANYVKGVILQFFFPDDATKTSTPASIPSFDAVIATDVPLGGGLSSSAAIEVSFFTFLECLTSSNTYDTLNGKKRKALLCQRAEHVTVGMPCGIMDQFISVLAESGQALLIDCRSHETRAVPLSDPEVLLLVTNSNVKHELTGGEYAKRRSQCGEAVDALKAAFPDQGITALRDVTLDQVKQVAAALGGENSIAFRRSRHVISENNRTVLAADALSRGDYKTVGELMTESHRSLRDDYEVSCEELDILVDLALQVNGVFGSRMTGGGFGGCTVTLLQRSALNVAITHLCDKYHEKTGKQATIFSTTPGEGAKLFDVTLL